MLCASPLGLCVYYTGVGLRQSSRVVCLLYWSWIEIKMSQVDRLKTALTFLLCGAGAVTIITIDVAMREHSKIQPTSLSSAAQHHDFRPEKDTKFGVCSMKERKQTIRRHCASRKSRDTETNPNYDNIQFDEMSQILYCADPNIDREFLKTTLSTLSEYNKTLATTSITDFNPQPLSSLAPADIESILRTYHKVMLVEHPWNRLMSFYNRTLQPNVTFRRDINRYVNQHFNRDFKDHPTLKLDEFLHIVVNTEIVLESHARLSYSEMCQPCDLDYEYIFKAETIDGHMLHIVDGQPDSLIVYNPFHADLQALQTGLLDKLRELHQNDLELFAYGVDNETTLYCRNEVPHEDGKCC